jgi:hypothetical protein
LASAAIVAVTEQVPLLLVMVTSPLLTPTEQAPEDPNVNAPVPEPPEVPTVKVAP